MIKKISIELYKRNAKVIRRNILKMIAKAKGAHIGSSLSVTDILTMLYFGIMDIKPKNPLWEGRDRLIFSKGHAAAALYATLVQKGFASKKKLDELYINGGSLPGHPIEGCLPGVEVSTGSLGHGLPMALGMALVAKYDEASYRIFTILSEGDCQEGTNWEAAMMASQLKLDNLIVIVDYNKIQAMGDSKKIMNLEPFAQKWQSFGWRVKEIDGHNYIQLHRAFSKLPFCNNKPSIIIAHTIKGKGISFMENKLAWHYQYPNEEQLKQASKELQ